MSVIGVDPGLGGALACMDYDGKLSIMDMPSWHMMVGKKTRKRIDAIELIEYFEYQQMAGVELVVIEAVGGRPKQSASAAFVFGYTVGLVYMACVATRLPIETVPPQVWKKIMNVPGKRAFKKDGATDKDYENAIMHRADEMMPAHTALWRGPNGGKKLDRAEAAMLAKYGIDHALNSTRVTDIRDPEWKLAYQNADTGA